MVDPAFHGPEDHFHCGVDSMRRLSLIPPFDPGCCLAAWPND